MLCDIRFLQIKKKKLTYSLKNLIVAIKLRKGKQGKIICFDFSKLMSFWSRLPKLNSKKKIQGH